MFQFDFLNVPEMLQYSLVLNIFFFFFSDAFFTGIVESQLAVETEVQRISKKYPGVLQWAWYTVNHKYKRNSSPRILAGGVQLPIFYEVVFSVS